MDTTEIFELTAEVRTGKGRGASRRLRQQGKVPAILYGTDKDPMPLTLLHKELAKNLENESFYSHLLTIHIGEGAQQAVLKDLQRHPFRPVILHVDLMRVSETQEIEMRVPLRFINEESCYGVKIEGGVVSHHVVEVEVRCLPKDLPRFIEVNVNPMKVGDILHLTDLSCPKNVELISLQGGNDLAVVSVHLTRAAAAEDEETTVAEVEKVPEKVTKVAKEGGKEKVVKDGKEKAVKDSKEKSPKDSKEKSAKDTKEKGGGKK
jgi:large subunit ribosomal protein L25